MAATSRERGFRRKKFLIVMLGVVLIAVAFAAFIVLRHGVDGVVHFFTTPTMEAESGRKYTPTSGIKRAFEKLEEGSEPQE